jgi:hypothetical protein
MTLTTERALAIVLKAAGARAADLEHLARQPFSVLSAQTPQKAATAWAARQRDEAIAELSPPDA